MIPSESSRPSNSNDRKNHNNRQSQSSSTPIPAASKSPNSQPSRPARTSYSVNLTPSQQQHVGTATGVKTDSNPQGYSNR